MGPRHTLLLAAVFVLLAAYLYLFEFQRDARIDRLLSFKDDEVEGFVLSYPGQEVQLQRGDSGKWRITHPIQAAADEAVIRTLLSALSASEVIRIVERKPGAEDLKAFGLDEPEIRVRVYLENGITLPPLLIGARTPLGNSIYVQRGSELPVFLTAGSLRSTLEKEVEDFRDKERLGDLKEAEKE